VRTERADAALVSADRHAQHAQAGRTRWSQTPVGMFESLCRRGDVRRPSVPLDHEVADQEADRGHQDQELAHHRHRHVVRALLPVHGRKSSGRRCDRCGCHPFGGGHGRRHAGVRRFRHGRVRHRNRRRHRHRHRMVSCADVHGRDRESGDDHHGRGQRSMTIEHPPTVRDASRRCGGTTTSAVQSLRLTEGRSHLNSRAIIRTRPGRRRGWQPATSSRRRRDRRSAGRCRRWWSSRRS